ncbi:major facilitator superfamily domain-containing protein [Hygrophoropsis aurantiaca]|uniref:Major facilitator superfamily domain-containing protein n=1 Tax=Hygrophoropsis aurantiaca TaxID=72124 RepID=A0ACB8AQ18_9AGAM|nr:major facilitator superfamily domain-containing protein [Hygrophoropsis aurantiaca]
MHEDHTSSIADEERPLLPSRKAKIPSTPLPKLQIAVLLIVQLAEPISSMCIYPFINQLVRELDITGGDETKVGYYAGLIESLFFATQAVTVLRWSRLSDRIGRKPVLLIGLFGLCISMLAFGLSKTFWALVISRCICGMLNGNIGVMKSMMGELTDSTNMARGFSFMPIVWCVGATIGPFMGGHLVRPRDHFPGIFTSPFWGNYPYFLPCAAAASFTAISFILILLFLKETLPSVSSVTPSVPEPGPSNATASSSATSETVPFRSLLTPSIVIPVANYATLALVEIAVIALQPLFYSTPHEYGGLDFTPSVIGSWVALFGFVDGIFQLCFFAEIVGRLGPKRTFLLSVSCFIPIIAIFPIMSSIVQVRGVDPTIWFLLTLQLSLTVVLDMSFGCILMFITSAAPTKRSLGTINGMGQTLASIARAVGPAMATSLFAFSKERNLLGGNAVYAFLGLMACGLVYLASCLPSKLADRDDNRNQ